MAATTVKSVDEVANSIPILTPEGLGTLIKGHNPARAINGDGKIPTVGIYELGGRLYLINRVNGDFNIFSIIHVENSSIPRLRLGVIPAEQERALKAYLKYEAGLSY